MRTKSGLIVPALPELRPTGKRRRRTSLFMGFAAILEPDGSIAWQEDEWSVNALHDAGEQTMLNVFLKEQANVSKYLGLLNDATIAETDGTMSAVTEANTPASNGYNRQQIANTDWTDDGLQGGDYRFSAAEKTFGPASGANWTCTHVSLSTTATTAGVLLATNALSGTTTVNIGQSFKYVFRWTQQ